MLLIGGWEERGWLCICICEGSSLHVCGRFVCRCTHVADKNVARFCMLLLMMVWFCVLRNRVLLYILPTVLGNARMIGLALAG